MRKVFLQDSFAWVCGSCGKMNYTHPVMKFMEEEEFNEAFNAESPEGTGAYVELPPTIVVCPLCRESFETELELFPELEE